MSIIPTSAGGIAQNTVMPHPALYNLVDYADATHFAVNSGSWFDPNTWAGGVVPGDDARVVINSGVKVSYDNVSSARLFTVRVDGELNFATDTDSQMVIDTMVVADTGILTIGTAADPVQNGVDVDIIIANNGPIDVNWDPELLSRGLIAKGHVEMYGEEKVTHLKVTQDPQAGDTSVQLSDVPTGWQVGDTIVIAGTRYDGYKWDGQKVSFNPPEDEIRTITAISGNTVNFNQPLQYDHDAPRADLSTSVANYTRNVSIESENPDAGEIYERGHVMFMNNDDVDVRYVEFNELGRTDKSTTAQAATEFSNIAFDSNVKARYSLHLHSAGVDSLDNPAVLVGNAVYGSPGWGYVQHNTNALIDSNASYDTFGAGFVAESGNETGTWSNNIAIFAQGSSWANPKNGNDPGGFDNGQTGSGFFFQGRMVDAIDNIAVSTNSGFTYFSRARTLPEDSPLDTAIDFDPALFEFPDLFYENGVPINQAPIRSFDGNEAFASQTGLFIQKANPDQGHDVRTILQDFTAWEVINGADIAYTSRYLLKDFDVIGKTATQWSSAQTGINVGTNSSDISIVDARIEGFRDGIDITNKFTDSSVGNVQAHLVVNPTFLNVGQDYAAVDASKFTILDHSDLVDGQFQINLDNALVYDGSGSRIVSMSGEKIDSAGRTGLPGGTDNFNISRAEVIGILEDDGYFTSAAGKNYFVLKSYYSDRITGEIFKIGDLVELGSNVRLGNQYFGFGEAQFNGVIDLNSAAPVVGNETASFVEGQTITVDLLANDSDPDGDTINLDGIVQPLYGRVTDNGDGSVSYTPYLGYAQTETLKYWVTDGFSNFTEGFLTLQANGSSGGSNPTPPPVDPMPSPVDPTPPHMDPTPSPVDPTPPPATGSGEGDPTTPPPLDPAPSPVDPTPPHMDPTPLPMDPTPPPPPPPPVTGSGEGDPTTPPPPDPMPSPVDPTPPHMDPTPLPMDPTPPTPPPATGSGEGDNPPGTVMDTGSDQSSDGGIFAFFKMFFEFIMNLFGGGGSQRDTTDTAQTQAATNSQDGADWIEANIFTDEAGPAQSVDEEEDGLVDAIWA